MLVKCMSTLDYNWVFAYSLLTIPFYEIMRDKVEAKHKIVEVSVEMEVLSHLKLFKELLYGYKDKGTFPTACTRPNGGF